MRIATITKLMPLSLLRLVAAAFVLAVLGSLAGLPAANAQQSNEKTFATPGEAVLAVYTAVKDNDQAALSAIFGTNSGDVLHSGDEVEDKKARQDFLRRYEQMHRVVSEPDGTVTLYMGVENWPFPISIVKTVSGAWYFDTESGKQEILYRRIGTNENDAIEICYALVQSQRDYASAVRGGESSKHYAMKFLSDEGKQNGLYWKTSSEEPPSPIGPLIADATSQGYTNKADPFHGYYFRMLTKQGAANKGGAKDYVVNGTLVRGFAFVAYPAQYKNCGVMTFIVNQNGVVYEKDLGPETQSIASGMTEYNPDDTWDPVDQ
jgi:Protein of unknown function (DUF2950)